MACKGLDDQLAVPKDDALRALLDGFVCVRLVQMWNVDLTQFQFDWALTWAVFFMNPDGTIYGRYGTRSAIGKQSSREISLAGFKQSTAKALALHKAYRDAPDATRSRLEGKRSPPPTPWRYAESIPRLAANERVARPFGGVSELRHEAAHGVGCIHCHMVADSQIVSLHQSKQEISEQLIWPYPMPTAVGMYLNPRRASTVQRVFENTPAAKAGVRPGDEVVAFGGQAIVSTADVQWVLHNTSGGRALPLQVERDGEVVELSLDLQSGWKRRLGDWRFINLAVCMQVAGFNGRPNRKGRGKLWFVIQRVHKKRIPADALQRGDVVVAIDGSRKPMNLGQMTAYLASRPPDSEVELTIQRPGADGERILTVRLN